MQIGQRLPAFSLPNQNGKMVRSGDVVPLLVVTGENARANRCQLIP